MDKAGHGRGSLSVPDMVAAPPGTMGRRLGQAVLGVPLQPWDVVEWSGDSILAVTTDRVYVAGWVLLRSPGGGWTAERPGPLAGPALEVPLYLREASVALVPRSLVASAR